MAQLFDARSGRLSGEPQAIAGPVKFHGGNDAAFDVSNDGMLIYRLDEGLASTRLDLLDRRGREMQPIAGPAAFRQPRFAPDMTRIAVEKSEADSLDSNIWIYDLDRRSAAQLTTSGTDSHPLWSPDGRRIIFSSKRGPYYNVYEKDRGWLGTGTSDRRLALRQTGPGPVGRRSIACGLRYLDADCGFTTSRRDRTSRSVPRRARARCRRNSRRTPSSSPMRSKQKDWHRSSLSRCRSRTHWLVSPGGGAEPHWRADGRELVYLSTDGWLMSVAIPADRAFTPSTPQRLFQVTVPELFGPADSTISRDGKRFVVNKLVAYPNVPSIHVIANWPALLKR